MLGAHVVALDDAQAAFGDPRQQLLARAQTEVLSQIGQHQPAFTLGRQMCRQARQKAAQHVAAFVIDGVLNRRAGACWQPRRVAHHQRCLPGGEHVHLLHFNHTDQSQALDILFGAGVGTRCVFGGHDVAHAAARQHRSQHASAGADVKRQLFRGQRRFGNQVDVFAAHRRKDAVVRVDALDGAISGFTQRRNLNTLFAPFVRANHAEQLAQRHHLHLARGRAPGFGQGFFPVGGAAQFDAVVAFDLNHQRAQRARPLRLRLAVQVEHFFGRGGSNFGGSAGGCFGRLVFNAALQGLQHQPGVLKITAPQHGSASTSKAIGRVSRQRVFGQLDAARRRSAAFGTPAR